MKSVYGECQEPKCRHPASKIWKGRKVCEDCYQHFSDEQDKMYMDLDE